MLPSHRCEAADTGRRRTVSPWFVLLEYPQVCAYPVHPFERRRFEKSNNHVKIPMCTDHIRIRIMARLHENGGKSQFQVSDNLLDFLQCVSRNRTQSLAISGESKSIPPKLWICVFCSKVFVGQFSGCSSTNSTFTFYI